MYDLEDDPLAQGLPSPELAAHLILLFISVMGHKWADDLLSQWVESTWAPGTGEK